LSGESLEHYTTIFDPGDIVRRDDSVGLVVETKVRFYHGYCRVLWAGSNNPKWELADTLRDDYV
jgi:hypothetical protein